MHDIIVIACLVHHDENVVVGTSKFYLGGIFNCWRDRGHDLLTSKSFRGVLPGNFFSIAMQRCLMLFDDAVDFADVL